MRFQAQECPQLQSLKLWASGTGQGERSLLQANADKPWVKALVQLRGLQRFEVIPLSIAMATYQKIPLKCREEIIPWLHNFVLEKQII